MAIKYTYLGTESPLYKESKAVTRAEAKAIDASLEQYDEMMKSKVKLNVEFTRVDKSGELDFISENGVRIRMLPEESEAGMTSIKRTQSLSRAYSVVVDKVDHENREVFVVRAAELKPTKQQVIDNIKRLLYEQRKIRNDAEKNAKKRMKALTEGELKPVIDGMKEKTRSRWERTTQHELLVEEMNRLKNKWIIVPAKVRWVDRDMAKLDILGFGIHGDLSKNHYSYAHISNFGSRLKVGDVIDVAILSMIDKPRDEKTEEPEKEEKPVKKGRGKKAAEEVKEEVKEKPAEEITFICGRTPLVENPWKTLPYNEGDRVKVTCTEITADHWFGVIKGFEEIELYCEMPEIELTKERLRVGKTYNCTIYKVRKETQLIKARTYSEAKSRRR